MRKVDKIPFNADELEKNELVKYPNVSLGLQENAWTMFVIE